MSASGASNLWWKIAAVVVVGGVIAYAVSRQSRPRVADNAPAEIRGTPIARAARATNAAPTDVPGADTNIATAAPNTSPPLPPTPEIPGYRHAGFDKLSSFGFDLADELLNPGTNVAAASAAIAMKIPATVKALDQQSAAITGFMLPLKVEGGTVTELLIMRDQSMCCFGSVPKINEWISVKMKGAGVKPLMDQPVTLLGTLHVGERRENGYLTGIYHMDGDKLVEP